MISPPGSAEARGQLPVSLGPRLPKETRNRLAAQGRAPPVLGSFDSRARLCDAVRHGSGDIWTEPPGDLRGGPRPTPPARAAAPFASAAGAVDRRDSVRGAEPVRDRAVGP